jgi:hypothetical protein
MAMYVFSTAGEAVGFVYGCFIHDLDGFPLGRILGNRVHRMDGSYAAEWFHNMVVDKRGSQPAPRSISPIAPPPRARPVSGGIQRRPAQEYGRYPDAFDRLYDGAPEVLAAE